MNHKIKFTNSVKYSALLETMNPLQTFLHQLGLTGSGTFEASHPAIFLMLNEGSGPRKFLLKGAENYYGLLQNLLYHQCFKQPIKIGNLGSVYGSLLL